MFGSEPVAADNKVGNGDFRFGFLCFVGGVVSHFFDWALEEASLGQEVAAHIVGIPPELEDVVVEHVGSETAVVGGAVENPIKEACVALVERYA